MFFGNLLPNTAFHPTTYSGLRPPPASGEFERWALRGLS